MGQVGSLNLMGRIDTNPPFLYQELKEMAERCQIPCSRTRSQALPVKRFKELANMLGPDLVEHQLGTMQKTSKFLEIAPVARDAVGRQTPLDGGVIQKVGKFRRNIGK